MVDISEDGSCISNSDCAYISIYYEHNVGTSTSWSQTDDNILLGNAIGDQFGFALASNGNGKKLIVGSPKISSQADMLGCLGRLVDISEDDDSHIIASGFSHSTTQRSRICLMLMGSSTWTDIADNIVG